MDTLTKPLARIKSSPPTFWKCAVRAEESRPMGADDGTRYRPVRNRAMPSTPISPTSIISGLDGSGTKLTDNTEA